MVDYSVPIRFHSLDSAAEWPPGFMKKQKIHYPLALYLPLRLEELFRHTSQKAADTGEYMVIPIVSTIALPTGVIFGSDLNESELTQSNGSRLEY